jgi:hypothetical protein
MEHKSMEQGAGSKDRRKFRIAKCGFRIANFLISDFRSLTCGLEYKVENGKQKVEIYFWLSQFSS